MTVSYVFDRKAHVIIHVLDSVCGFLFSVSALKPDEMPQVRIETEERQSAGYEVHHQKLVGGDTFFTELCWCDRRTVNNPLIVMTGVHR